MQDGKYYTITIKENELVSFLSILHKKNISFVEISIEKPTLEDYFLQNVGSMQKKTMEEIL